ncbi:MAG: S-adenosylmethionine--diacylglycerol 3-amino-3-carboxypropyl transferase [Rhodobacterales bacterium 32-66-7]|nr:MAG: S-adenosylmethionine--diacylglycerol 3-amino-3-carboxypropyl transferase [Rhodobacterales bacterium 32-66-7]
MTEAPNITGQLREAVHGHGTTEKTGVLERVFAYLFEGLVYPQIWEDPVVDMQALGIQPGEHMVCIASGSCNVLSYLTARPGGITAVDLSPAHVALGRLKLVAAQRLTQAQFFDLFGHADRKGNVALYDQHLAPHLDAESRTWWEGRVLGRRRITMFARGFYRFGVLGRFFAAIHAVSWLARLDYRPLLQAQSLEEQRQFFDTRIVPLLGSRPVRWLARRRASLFGLGIPPAQYDKLAADGGGDVLPVLKERIRKLVCDFPIAENYFAWQALARRYQPAADAALPPYLQPRNFDLVAAHADRVSVHNRSLTDLLVEKPARSVDAFVLLDAQDWMTDAQLNALWLQITRAARPGARVIFRTGGKADILPGRLAPGLLDQWSHDAEASATGHARDRSAIYGGFHLYRFGGLS